MPKVKRKRKVKAATTVRKARFHGKSNKSYLKNTRAFHRRMKRKYDL